MTLRVIKSAFLLALLLLTLNHSAYSTINPLGGVKAAQLDQANLNKSAKLASARLDGLNLPFIANAGQTDPKVGFYA
jgi:ABC-type arginine/histidine transport system permease subunit